MIDLGLNYSDDYDGASNVTWISSTMILEDSNRRSNPPMILELPLPFVLGY